MLARNHPLLAAALALAALAAPRPAAALDAQRKKDLALAEISPFRSWVGKYKSLPREEGNYKGQKYTIFKDSADPELKLKVAAVKSAVKAVVDKGVKLPSGLAVYCLGAYEAQNRGFKRDEAWKEVAAITLGYKATENNTGKTTMSTSGVKGFDKVTITTIHEIGHILHERANGDAFWEAPIQGPPGQRAEVFGKVSQYAAGNNYEFVAEVFAGQIIGKTFPKDVTDAYAELHGPVIASNNAVPSKKAPKTKK